MIFRLLILLFLSSTALAGQQVVGNLSVSGNVGVGTSSNVSIPMRLDVQGTARATNLTVTSISGTQCLHSISGVVSGTGSDCGSGGGSGNVGIGTTSRIPVYLSSTTIGSPYNNVMDANGNIGIGTSDTQGTQLMVYGNNQSSFVQLMTNNENALAEFDAYNSDNDDFAFGISGSGNSGGKQLYFYTASAIPYTFATNDQEYMRIDSTGNVGINSTVPGAALDVAGNISMHNTVDSTALGIGVGALVGIGTTNSGNIAIGYHALNVQTTGSANTAIGYLAGQSLTAPTPGAGDNPQFNTFLGYHAGWKATTSRDSTCIGAEACQSMTGESNLVQDEIVTAVGSQALYSLITGRDNVAVGQRACESMTTGAENVCIGAHSGDGATTANNDIWIGSQSGQLETDTTGNNTVVGNAAAQHMASGNNVVLGYNGITNSTGFSGGNSVFVGASVASKVTTAQSATILGYNAGLNLTSGNNSTLVGSQAGYQLSTGPSNTFVGVHAGGNSSQGISTGGRNVCIGIDSCDTAPSNISNAFISGSGVSGVENISDVYFGSGYSDTNPTSYTLHGTGGSGSNVAGGNVMIAGGIGTGTANGGNIVFQTSNVGVSTTSPNSLVTVATIKGANIGIGSTNPGMALDVVGTVLATGFSGNGSLLTNVNVATVSTAINATYYPLFVASSNNGNQTLNLSTNEWVFNPSNGNVGIGTLSTAAPLVVYSAANPQIQFGGNDSNNWAIGRNSSDSSLDFFNNGTQRITIASGGNFGIGTTAPPNSALYVAGGAVIGGGYVGSVAPSQGMIVQNNVGIGTVSAFSGLSVGNNGASIGTGYYGVSAPAGSLIVSGNVGLNTSRPLNRLAVVGAVSIGSAPSAGLTAPTNGLYVEGNVGIGSITPGQLLDVQGTVRISKIGSTLSIVQGTNACAGQATLSTGTVTVSTSCATLSTSKGIILTDAGGGVLGNIGSLSVGTVSAGTSFVINSSNAVDSSNVNWEIHGTS